MTERLLVTGAAGFIGANFCHYWLKQHRAATVLALDALTYAGNRENLTPLERYQNFRFVHGDINDSELVADLLRRHRIDTLVHFAAESHVDRSISGPSPFIATNIVGTYALLEAARSVWLTGDAAATHRFHHVSTDEVYGSLAPAEAAFDEVRQYQPNSPYSASKAASDHLVRAWHHTYGLNVTTSNCSNNYGPYHFPEKLIPLCLTNILRGKPLPVYGNGSNIRDWLYVEDHCRGIELILDQGDVGEVYNIGGNNEQSNLAVVEQLCAAVDERFAQQPALAEQYGDAPPAGGGSSHELITFVSDRPGHDWRYAIDARKIIRELGYQPLASFRDGLARTVDWYLANRRWWEPLLKGE